MDRVVIITGGSRGIGRAAALALAKGGDRICLGYASNEAAAREVVGLIEAGGGKAMAVRCDVGVEADIVNLFKTADGFGPLSGLVNNAGVVDVSARVEEMSGLVFVNLDLEATPLADQLGDLPARLERFQIGSLEAFAPYEGDQPANWKIVADNYLEGYHVPIAHPGLMRLYDYKRYTAEVHDYHDELTGVLASSLAKRAPGYTSLGFPDPRKLPFTPSANAATTT